MLLCYPVAKTLGYFVFIFKKTKKNYMIVLTPTSQTEQTDGRTAYHSIAAHVVFSTHKKTIPSPSLMTSRRRCLVFVNVVGRMFTNKLYVTDDCGVAIGPRVYDHQNDTGGAQIESLCQ